ncbi:MAG: FkbM family methyltransferase [Acidobacteriaceae bacterium]|nr:FkbM family methyltransferase [Acidobacteriaceae bacterium]MBV9501243.1 FkbM family methyltransferase [Acidobacteriaceae bacterium]
MTLIRRVWSAIPDGATKDWLRLVGNNYVQRGSARFSRRNGSYISGAAEFTLVTTEPAFEFRRLIDQFEHRHRIKPGEVVIDAGAFNGILMSIFGLQVGPTGRVVAFEPDALNREKTLSNWKLNGSPTHVEVIPAALWDCETEIEFCERGALGSSAFWDGPGGHKITVRTTTLDQVVRARGLQRVDFVKMNIEGAEIKALHGADETISRFRPCFAISSDHFVDGDSLRGERTCGPVEEMLRGRGYMAETIRFGTEWVTYGTPST